MRAHAAITAAMLATALAAGCRGGSSAPQANAAQATPTVPAAAPTPQQVAQRMVAQHLRSNAGLRFADEQVFTSAGATIVCGRFQQPGQAAARYIAIGEDDVFVETQMQAGHMDQAVTEFCRNG